MSVEIPESQRQLLHVFSQRKRPRTLPNSLAYTRLFFLIAGRVLKYTGHYIVGKSPKGQSYSVGCGVAMLQPAEEYLNVHQARAFMRLGIWIMDSESGVRSEKEKAAIGIWVGGDGLGGTVEQSTNLVQVVGETPAAEPTPPAKTWKGFWVPYQNHGPDGPSAADKVEFVTNSAQKIGQGCDKVILFTHGGGFMDGNARMYLDIFRRWMTTAYDTHKIKIGFLSMEYSLSPETPFPGALDECIAAYKDLVGLHQLDPKNIFFGGDSAGANLAITIAIKIRDTLPGFPLPAGIISISPFMSFYEPFECSLYDYISPIGCQAFVEYYTQLQPEYLNSPHYSPLNATTLAGLPPTLVFVGGVEIFRQPIETFVERAQRDGVEITLEVGVGRSHDSLMVPQICPYKDISAGHEKIAAFMSAVSNAE
ncbi:hypothetical protein EMPS_03906 [Entomortierella parvispora]|uniref:Alpha/beta hydrolase fold-3 domain-containing protein n=1 Tax=Entomortierella parvispora TaxID=205924 RepID=A0A9P3H7I3_9FUNG|nr:hypothetical protein EMPS_03906 [Entomortierella parvispora]